MGRSRTFLILLGAAAAGIAVARHYHGAARGREVPGGMLIGDAGAYDKMSRRVLGPLYGPIAADAASAATDGARVLEVGCGPGHLSIMLARQHGLDVTGLDLDPAMIERARINVDQTAFVAERPPSFLVGDVASMPFPDGSFDLVVSTMSMHHWADPTAGLAEIRRVLRPGAMALVWDFRPGVWRFHAHAPAPVDYAPLRVAGVTLWRWPWWFSLIQRIELVSTGDPPGQKGHR